MINKFKKNLSLILTCIMIYSLTLVVSPTNHLSAPNSSSISQSNIQVLQSEDPPAL